jgi:hypothetical protein
LEACKWEKSDWKNVIQSGNKEQEKLIAIAGKLSLMRFKKGAMPLKYLIRKHS